MKYRVRFQDLHPPPSAEQQQPEHSFFFVGDTQAHLMNFTNLNGPPGSVERKKQNPLPGGLEWGMFAPSYRMGPAVGALMTRILTLVGSHFASEHVYWAAGWVSHYIVNGCLMMRRARH
jgi:hypothetical protein